MHCLNPSFSPGPVSPKTTENVLLAKSDHSEVHETRSPQSDTTPLGPIYGKKDIGADVQEKIRYANQVFYEKGMTEEQVLWTLALADHESAGTWSEAVKGDNGCSTGIGQWNSCPGSGRKAAPTYEGQVEQLANEMIEKYRVHDIKTAVGKHNAPAWDSNPNYVYKVERAIPNFIILHP